MDYSRLILQITRAAIEIGGAFDVTLRDLDSIIKMTGIANERKLQNVYKHLGFFQETGITSE